MKSIIKSAMVAAALSGVALGSVEIEESKIGDLKEQLTINKKLPVSESKKIWIHKSIKIETPCEKKEEKSNIISSFLYGVADALNNEKKKQQAEKCYKTEKVKEYIGYINCAKTPVGGKICIRTKNKIANIETKLSISVKK